MKHPKSYDTTPETSRRMGRVRLKRGLAETALAKALWHSGIRYRLNFKKLPGSPDIAITRHHIAVFVDGEFWHGKDWEARKPRLNRNREYWIQKIEENMARDRRNDRELTALGWQVVRFWEKDVKKSPDRCADAVIAMIVQNDTDLADPSAVL